MKLLSLFLCLHVVVAFRWNGKFGRFRNPLHMTSLRSDYSGKPYVAVMIVPTGIGATIGGYAGDALPSAKLLASAVDVLITHPNVLNAAMLYWPMNNVLYVEGSALDSFAAQKLLLKPLGDRRGQKIGLLLDKGIESELLLRHLQVAESMKASLGLDIAQIVITSSPAVVTTEVSPYSGASWGTVKNIEPLVEGAKRLKELGCTAIAVVVRFPETSGEEEAVCQSIGKSVETLFQDYRKGQGVDAIAGVEAIISRVISQEVGLPVAHAPAFNPMEVEEGVSPKAAAEEIGYTFLPCVLANLHRTPDLIPVPSEVSRREPGLLHASDVDAVVVPSDALGGPAVLSLLSQGKLVLAVTDNHTTMDVTKDSLLSLLTSERAAASPPSLTTTKVGGQIVVVRSYAEAAGYLLAHKSGILFEAISSQVSSIPIEKL